MNVLQCLSYYRECFLQYCEYDDDYSHIGYCRICLEAIRGPAYRCGDSYIHKSCAESPGEIQHPLHNHPLRLCDIGNLVDYLICDGCHTFSPTHKYCCIKCDVKFDFQCVSKQVESQALKERVEKVTDYHQHKLQLVYFPFVVLQTLGRDQPICCCCLKGVEGSVYVCLGCVFHIHESCLDTIPKQVKGSFHPQHSLLPRAIKESEQLFPRSIKESKQCHACLKEVSDIELSCPICEYSFHVSCGKRMTPGLRLQDHEHTLFYFDYWDQSGSGTCDICHQICEGPVYRCIQCRKNFHVECLVPPVLNHECHHHELTLTSSIVPKGSANKYRCDVCEEEEDFEHYVYHCEDCEDYCNFRAHIECLFSEEDNPPLVDSEQQIDEVQEAETENDQAAEESDVESEISACGSEDGVLLQLNKKMSYLTAKIDKLTTKLNLLKEKYEKKLSSQS